MYMETSIYLIIGQGDTSLRQTNVVAGTGAT